MIPLFRLRRAFMFSLAGVKSKREVLSLLLLLLILILIFFRREQDQDQDQEQEFAASTRDRPTRLSIFVAVAAPGNVLAKLGNSGLRLEIVGSSMSVLIVAFRFN